MAARSPITWLVLFIVLCSCKSEKSINKKIFRYNETSGIASLDPAFARNQSIMWAVHQLYSTLVEVDDELEVQPMIARSWKFSDDKRTITFNLKNNIFFHDDPCFKGIKRRLTANDVVYSFKRILDPVTASPGAWIFSGRVDHQNAFSAQDDSTFIIKLKEPFQPVLGILSMPYCSIIPKEAVEFYSTDFRRHPVGTGPFAFVAWEEGQALILKKNSDYFEKDLNGNALPYLDGIKVSFLESKASEFLQFRQGKLDFINDIDPSFKDELLTRTGRLKAQWSDRLTLNKHAYLNIEYFGILMDSSKISPLQNKLIRQAINYAIDRKKLIFYLRNSIGTPAENGFIPKGMPAFSDSVKGYSYDPVRSKNLLRQAGYSYKNPVTLFTIPQYSNLAAYAVNELSKAGMNVKVETVQKSLLLEMTAKGQAEFFRGSWIADYPDAENFLGVFYSKHPAPPNYTRYNNPAFDALYEKALTETVDSVRYLLYNEMDKIIIEDAPVVPLWYDMVLHLVHKRVANLKPNSMNMLELRRVDVKP